MLSCAIVSTHHRGCLSLCLILPFWGGGGVLTLIGTSTHLIVNGLLEDRGFDGLAFFSFLPVGLCLLVACAAVIIVMSRYFPLHQQQERDIDRYFIDAKVRKCEKGVNSRARPSDRIGFVPWMVFFLLKSCEGGV
ncbi:hypothetical protein VCRA2133E348_210065 [Vibrio crassostreae]|nr:hypothetical protein VCRA2119O48_200067 [Vibrio crassostreae]CAK2771299.1 hypothetical protein VCRA2133E348_210065 [Vibrio crassostreae]CAK3220900.1 hypothetical protein VCRA213O314_190034 [Vibrio crassostreae]